MSATSEFTVYTSAALKAEMDAPQVFGMADTIELRKFLESLPWYGCVFTDDCEFVEERLTWRVVDNTGRDVTHEIPLHWDC